MVKEVEYSFLTGIKKTFKNYAVPFIGMALVFLQTNCNPEAIVAGGVTLGTIIAVAQNYFKVKGTAVRK